MKIDLNAFLKTHCEHAEGSVATVAEVLRRARDLYGVKNVRGSDLIPRHAMIDALLTQGYAIVAWASEGGQKVVVGLAWRKDLRAAVEGVEAGSGSGSGIESNKTLVSSPNG